VSIFLFFTLFYSEKGVKKVLKEQTVDKFINKEGKEDNDKTKLKKLMKAYEFFYRNSAHLEIMRENRLNKVYFIILPFCHCLQKVFIDIFFHFYDFFYNFSSFFFDFHDFFLIFLIF